MIRSELGESDAMRRKLRVGMVGGGGPANFFGAPHRRAILMDNAAELTAGALRSKPEESIESARDLFFARGYGDWASMIEGRGRAGPIGADRLRHDRHPQRRPLRPGRRRRLRRHRRALREAADDHARRGEAASAVVQRGQIPFVVAYTYTGFPMVMLARELVKDGAIGEVRKVEAWYPTRLAGHQPRGRAGQKQAAWRVDPAKAGASGCGGDIGTHAYEFVRFVAGQSATRLSARLTTFVHGRALDDDFTVLAELENGGIATIAASQITIGAQNDNGFRVSGTKGTLEWSITDHNVLKHYRGGPAGQALPARGRIRLLPGLDQAVHPRPVGPPRGVPRGAGEPHMSLQLAIRAEARRGRGPAPFEHPGIVDGVAGMAFIEAAVASSSRAGSGSRWRRSPEDAKVR